MPELALAEKVRAASDGGLTVNAGDSSLDDLLSAAAAASSAQVKLRLVGVRSKPIEDLIRIAVTGGDCVVFAGDSEVAAKVPPAASPPKRGWFFRA